MKPERIKLIAGQVYPKFRGEPTNGPDGTVHGNLYLDDLYEKIQKAIERALEEERGGKQ